MRMLIAIEYVLTRALEYVYCNVSYGLEQLYRLGKKVYKCVREIWPLALVMVLLLALCFVP